MCSALSPPFLLSFLFASSFSTKLRPFANVQVRGHAKQAAQEAARKKAAGASGGKSQLGEARQKGLKFTCPNCKGQNPVSFHLAPPPLPTPNSNTFIRLLRSLPGGCAPRCQILYPESTGIRSGRGSHHPEQEGNNQHSLLTIRSNQHSSSCPSFLSGHIAMFWMIMSYRATKC